jgi:hypothetical protein
MKELMEKMMDKKKEGKKADKKAAKMDVLKNLHEMASGMMGDKLSEMKKVTVAAKDDEGLEKGLEKAKEMVKKKEDDEE